MFLGNREISKIYRGTQEVSKVYKGQTEVFSGLSIIQEGLVLHLDAGNPSSYPGTGTTWTDLTGNGYNGTLQNGTAFSSNNGGYLDLDGSNDFISLNLASISSTTLTIELWCNSDSTGTQYFWDARNGGGTWMLSEYDGYDWNWGNIVRYNDGNSFNTWHQHTVVKDGTTSYIYKNGIQKATGGDANGTLGNSFYLGTRYTQSNWWNGKMSIFRIYTRALSGTEILQNFNFNKDRYGL